MGMILKVKYLNKEASVFLRVAKVPLYVLEYDGGILEMVWTGDFGRIFK